MPRHAHLQRFSVEEYLEGELHSEIRHEYVAGRVFAMVGGTLGHNRLLPGRGGQLRACRPK